MIEEQILSKVLDTGNLYELNRFNVTADDFPNHKEVYEYVVDYHRNHGGTPDYRTIAAEFEDFEYQANVSEPFKGLAARLKQDTAKRKAYDLLQNQAGEKFSNLQGDKFVKWLHGEVETLAKITSTDYSLGTNFAINGRDREEDYFARKERRTFQYIPYPYPTLTAKLGGMELGDYILLMAYTNRGKSWIGSQIGVNAWRHNFGVLHYSPELSKTQQMTRLETLDGHFNNVALKRGELMNEAEYLDYLKGFNPSDKQADYIIKTMEDLPNGLTTDVIEADLEIYPDTKLVIIDGFNLMVHNGRDGNRNNMSNTSRRLRQIFGKYGVAGLVIHQTNTQGEKENTEKDEAGVRLVKPPELLNYGETIAVVQDAATVLTFDASDGVGKLAVRKAREPAVGEVIDLQCNFNMGFIREPEASDMF